MYNNTLLLIPTFTFVLVSGLALFGVWIWLRKYSPQAKAKKQRLNDLLVFRLGKSINQSKPQGLISTLLDTWLRKNTRAYVKLEQLIIQAHMQLTPMQLLASCLVLWATTTVMAIAIHAPLILLVLISGCAASIPVLRLNYSAKKRRQQFESKLPEALDFIARALRAGHSITVAIGMAGDELSEPIGSEFKTVFDEIGFGISFQEAMTEMTQRIRSSDLDFLVTALLIQKETGGNLTELLDGLSKTVRDRIKFQGKIKTLSSEGRLSAILLGTLPFILSGVLSLLNPQYMSVLWQTQKGQSMLITGALLLMVGFISLSRIIRIKV